ncbi:MAG: L-threonylcarbamoyladenylate synthase [Eubacteriales bacterium]|jgi:L-threonylcarbamoyladenylate synthase|nr:threonylcarbamoyl-AMP synthase [Lachnospiraceae bacterium]MDD5860481.1 L-threonylcarbamoyladenylate synthase [Eubacteriales bacterium]MCH4063337.1 threonylcarbamoyl-AMP synthase [Lachnospiraceae bacterium]MCH4104488.1 threonylcarbamoyl-AMP synthase [Lachnospiraceae bacterium]MCI1309231.1 threonylcarbamoyl-AMP synthase [Lachnospiraceae bacterium]
MKTEIVKIDPKAIDEVAIAHAGDILKRGGLVAFPTETVYGLGGDALNPDASRKIYAAKGRPSDNPLIVHIADMEHLEAIAEYVPDNARRLAAAYWPGPLTMIFNKKAIVPYETTGGLDTVAVRMPSDPIAAALIRAEGGYIAAPSANTSGRPSPTTAQHVIDDLDGRIDMIIDGGGVVKIGVESTIVDFTDRVPTILRPGYINLDMLEQVLGEVKIDPGIIDANANKGIRPKAPGMRYRHYAPKADMTIVEGEENAVVAKIVSLAREAAEAGKKVGIIATDATGGRYADALRPYLAGKRENAYADFADPSAEARQSASASSDGQKRGSVDIRDIGTRDDDRTIARHLFAELRQFDDDGVDVIFSEAFETPRMGMAIMNRLKKAAGQKLIRV